MRIFLFLFSLFGFVLGASAATEMPAVCTKEYVPVCAQPPMPECAPGMMCVQVMPQRETYANTCVARGAKATDIVQGECGSLMSIVPIVGGDSDEHGCKASAGYMWDPMMAECIRPWEKSNTIVNWAYKYGLTKFDTVEQFGYDRAITRQEAAAIFARAGEKVWGLRYASFPDNCNLAYRDESQFDSTLKENIYSACAFGMMHGQDGKFSPVRTLSRAEALVIVMRAVDGGKKDESGAMWYENYADRAHELDILSFANFKGFDHAISRGELIEWIHRATTYMKQKTLTDSDLLGTWNIVEFSGSVVQTGMTLEFQTDNYSAKICNSINGAYSVKDKKISIGSSMSTLMYCENSMSVEDAFSLDGATYSIITVNPEVGSAVPGMFLTITTSKGATFRLVK